MGVIRAAQRRRRMRKLARERFPEVGSVRAAPNFATSFLRCVDNGKTLREIEASLSEVGGSPTTTREDRIDMMLLAAEVYRPALVPVIRTTFRQ